MAQSHELPVHLGTGAVVAHLGVDRIGEVDGCRAGGKRDHLSARREHVDLIREQIDAHGLQKFVRIAEILLPLQQLAQPGKLPFVRWAGRTLVLVPPVRRDSQLRDAMHLLGPDLYLDPLAERADDRRVQGLVAVRLGHGHVVLEPAGHGAPQAVDNAERLVTGRGRTVDDDAEGDQVIDLVHRQVLVPHLLVQTVDFLQSARHLHGKSGLAQQGGQPLAHVLDITFTLGLISLDQFFDRSEDFGVDLSERPLLELLFQPVDSEPMRQRCVDV